MQVGTLIEHLEIFPPETEVYIQTVKTDFCQPLERKLISVIKASLSEAKHLEPAKLLFTAHVTE